MNRRLKKGRRAKSGQWWRRAKSTSWFGVDMGYEGEDRTVRCVIDEVADPIPMDALQRCAPQMTGGTKIEASTGFGASWTASRG